MYDDHEPTLQNNYYAPLTPSMDNRRRAITTRNLQLAHHADGKVAASGRDIDEEILGTYVSKEAEILHYERTSTSAWTQLRLKNVFRHPDEDGGICERNEGDSNIHCGGIVTRLIKLLEICGNLPTLSNVKSYLGLVAGHTWLAEPKGARATAGNRHTY